MISVTCPSCQTTIHLSEQLAGKTIRCMQCQQIFTVGALPNAPESPPRPVKTVQPISTGQANRSDPYREGLQTRPGRVPPPILKPADDSPPPAPRRPIESRPSRRQAEPPSPESSSKSNGLIIGGMVGGAVVLVGIIIASILMFQKRDAGANDSMSGVLVRVAQEDAEKPRNDDAAPRNIPDDGVARRQPPGKMAPQEHAHEEKAPQPQAAPKQVAVNPEQTRRPQPQIAEPPLRPQADPKGTAMPPRMLETIKKATVFVKVDQGGSSFSGSGFVMASEGLIAYVVTNHHVVKPELSEQRERPGGPPGLFRPPFGPFGPMRSPLMMARTAPPIITVVFGSGTPQELSVRAEVLAADKERDLAVLQVRGIQNMPQPVDTSNDPALVETTPVYMFGFPLGQLLDSKRANPAVTVSPGSISSLRRDQHGKIDRIQVDIDMNDGNSGGPVVDGQGRLVGIAVSGFDNTRLNFVIPPEKLAEFAVGRVSSAVIARKKVNQGSAELQGEVWVFDSSSYRIRSTAAVNLSASSTRPTKKGVAEIEVQVNLVDPMKKIKTVAIRYRLAEDAMAEPQANENGSWPVLHGATKVNLEVVQPKATATLDLNELTTTDRYFFQVEFQKSDGQTVYTQAHSFSLNRPKTNTVAGPPAAPANPERPPPPATKLFEKQPRVYLSDMEEFNVKSGPWPVSKNGALGDPDQRTIQVKGVASAKGISMHPPDGTYAAASFRPGKQANLFKAEVALNDSTNFVLDAAVFEVWGDGKRLWQSKPIHEAKQPQQCRVDVSGVDILELRVNSTRSHFGLHAVWVEPRLLQKPDTPDKN